MSKFNRKYSPKMNLIHFQPLNISSNQPLNISSNQPLNIIPLECPLPRDITHPTNFSEIPSIHSQSQKEEIKDQKDDEDEISILLNDFSFTDSKPSSKSPSPFNSRSSSPFSQPTPSNTKPNQFAYSKFCQTFVEDGECNQSGCTYAHSISQLNPVRCNFGEKCRNLYNPRRECGFIHPQESKEQFLHRVKMVVPENIKMAEVLEHQKKLGQEQKKKKETEPLYPIVTIFTSNMFIFQDISFLQKYNITNFHITIIPDNEVHKRRLIWNLEEDLIYRLNKMIEMNNIDNEFTSSFHLQKSVVINGNHLTGPVKIHSLFDFINKDELLKLDKIEDDFIFISV